MAVERGVWHMSELPLKGRTILITGAARHLGASLARACGEAGANIIVPYHHSEQDAIERRDEIREMGVNSWLIEADLRDPRGVSSLIGRAVAEAGPLYGLVNNAALFEPLSMEQTTLEDWERHMMVNLTAPFLLTKAFAAQVPADAEGRIVNLVDWRAMRPGADHFPYTISKAALASLTRATAAAVAPNISVNALALGAILPPTDAGASPDLLKSIPAARWGELHEVDSALLFLLAGPAYVTGEVIHVDGGRHLV